METMTSVTIRKLPELLRNYLGPNKTVKNTNISRLTAPGENFGSIMLKFDITVEDTENETEDILHAVAKILPDTELFRKLFNIQVTYTNEMAFYDIIVPKIQNFQKKLGISGVIDCFPKCIATRKNLLKNSDEIDDDAVIILENLKVLGFDNVERTAGFDFETTKMILRDLALFHAVFISYRIKEPEEFEKHMKPHFHDYMPFEEGVDLVRKLITLIIAEDEDIAHLASKVNPWGSVSRTTQREPFATVIHTDLWVNNMMQKFENGRPTGNKLVDFQVYTYGSPAADLLFFLWTSVSKNALEKNLDYFIRYYYDRLIEKLVEHQCDVTRYTFDNFLKELLLESDFEVGHILFFIMLTINGNHELKMDGGQSEYEQLACIRPQTKEKVWYFIRECSKRGWLK